MPYWPRTRKSCRWHRAYTRPGANSQGRGAGLPAGEAAPGRSGGSGKNITSEGPPQPFVKRPPGRTRTGPPQGASGLPRHRGHTRTRPGAASGPAHPGGRRLGGIRAQKTSKHARVKLQGPYARTRGGGHRDGGPWPQLTGGPEGGGSRKDCGPPHRGGRSRTAMWRTKKPKRLLWGIILSLIVAPLGWGPPGAHTPPLPEPQAPPDQQLTEPSVDPGSEGTLQATAGEILYPLKPVGNTGEFWTAPPPGGFARGAARGFTNAQFGRTATHDRFQGVTHCPKHQEREEDTNGLGTDPPCQPTRCRPRPQERRSHPGWPGWEGLPGVPKLQPRHARDPNRGPEWIVAQAPEGQRGRGCQGTTVVQTQGGWCGHATTLPGLSESFCFFLSGWPGPGAYTYIYQ